MAFSLSPIGNEQQANSNGAPLSGGLLYTYLAGSTTPAPTYTDSTGTTPQANPVVLNTLGRPTDPVWLTDGVAYKFVLTSSVGAAQWTIDNITGVSSSIPTQDEWVLQSTVPTYINATQFSVPGDQTSTFTVGRRVRAVCTAGVRYGYISVSAFTTLTTITLVLDADTLDSGISAVSVGLLSSVNSSIPLIKTSASGLTVQGTLTVMWATTLAGNAASALQAVPKQQLDASVSAETAARTAAISAAVLPATIAPTLLVAGTAVTTSGSASYDFTGIPSWAKRITLMFDAISTNGSSSMMVQIGDAGGIEDTGYLGCSSIIAAASVATTAFTTGIGLRTTAAGDVIHGAMVWTKVTGNEWVAAAQFGFSNSAATGVSGGRKSLSDTLTQIRLTTVGGSDAFDGGKVNILYE